MFKRVTLKRHFPIVDGRLRRPKGDYGYFVRVNGRHYAITVLAKNDDATYDLYDRRRIVLRNIPLSRIYTRETS